MSYNNPNVREILDNSTGIREMRKQLCKSYLNLAKGEFFQKNKTKATLENSQELYDIFENQWKDYYIDKPARDKKKRQDAKYIWRYGIRYKIDVYAALCRFLEYKYSPFIETPDRTTTWFNKIAGKLGYYNKNAGDLMKEMDIEFIEVYILDNNLFEEWKEFIEKNKANLNKYHKSTFIDYSHLAYNGVTDDF